MPPNDSVRPTSRRSSVSCSSVLRVTAYNGPAADFNRLDDTQFYRLLPWRSARITTGLPRAARTARRGSGM